MGIAFGTSLLICLVTFICSVSFALSDTAKPETFARVQEGYGPVKQIKSIGKHKIRDDLQRSKFEKKYRSSDWVETNYVGHSKPIVSPDGKFSLHLTESQQGAGHVADYEVKINIENKTFKILEGIFSSVGMSPQSNYILMDKFLIDVKSRKAFDLSSDLTRSYCGVFRWSKDGKKIIVLCNDVPYDPSDSDYAEYFQIVLK